MITKAIIEEMMADGYHVRVRIPILHKIENAPGATPFKELPLALVNYAPGCKPNFSAGDVVYVGFENNQYSEPVVLGALLNDSYMTMSGSILADAIQSSTGDDFFSSAISENLIEADLTNEEYSKLLGKISELYI